MEVEVEMVVEEKVEVWWRRRRRRRRCWYIAVNTLSTLGSLFSSIPPYRVVRDSGM